MPRPFAPVAALGAGALAALALAACGGEDAKLLPGETAREINANLDTVKQLAGEGDCVGAESAVQQVGEQIEALTGVDRKLKQALESGASRLGEVIAECEEEPAEAIAPAAIPNELEAEEEEESKEKGDKGKEGKPKDEEPAPEKPAQHSLPPQAKGEAKGHEEGGESGPPEQEGGEVAPSGGVSPGAPAAGGNESGEGGGD